MADGTTRVGMKLGAVVALASVALAWMLLLSLEGAGAPELFTAGWKRGPATVSHLDEASLGLPPRFGALNLSKGAWAQPPAELIGEQPHTLAFRARLGSQGELGVVLVIAEGEAFRRATLWLWTHAGSKSGWYRRGPGGAVEPLNCPGAAPSTLAAEPWHEVSLRMEGNQALVSINGEALTPCGLGGRPVAWRLQPAYANVYVDDIVQRAGDVVQWTAAFNGPEGRFGVALLLWGLCAALLGAAAGWLYRRSNAVGQGGAALVWIVGLCVAPLMIGALLLSRPFSVQDSLRIPHDLWPTVVLVLGLVGAYALAAPLLMAHLKQGPGEGDEPRKRRFTSPLMGSLWAFLGGSALVLALAQGGWSWVPALGGGAAHLVVTGLFFMWGGRRTAIPVGDRVWLEAWVAALLMAAGALAAGLVVVDVGNGGVALALGAVTAGLYARLAFVNVHAGAHRDVNGASLLLFVLMVAAAEVMLSATSLASQWGPDAADLPQSDEPRRPVAYAQRQLKAVSETRRYQHYPADFYPAEPPPRDAPWRIICLGGSSTGGAFQYGSLDAFYPARLQAYLRHERRDVQVVNQGVGGWNTFLIRRYVEDPLVSLDADLITLYVGNNDLLTYLPQTYAELWQQRSAQPTVGDRVREVLRRSVLYGGMRHVLLGRVHRDVSRRPAVPLEDARENLAAIIAAARREGVSVLLMEEALYPYQPILEDYRKMLQSLADGEDVRYLPAASHLLRGATQALFLDNVHLSREGADKLAQIMGHALLGWGWAGPEAGGRKTEEAAAELSR